MSTVDVRGRSRDVVRCGRAQKCNQVRNLLWYSQALPGSLLLGQLHQIFRIAVGAGATNDSGGYCVDANLVRRPLDRQALGQVVNASARGSSVGHTGKAAIDLGNDVEDATALLRNHRRFGHSLRHGKGADQVVLDDLLKVLKRHVRSGEGSLPTSVIDKDVNSSKLRQYALHKRGNLRGLANVASLRKAGESRSLQFCCGFL